MEKNKAVKLTILGSGTGFPSSIRGGPGYLLQTEGQNLIMDLGMGTLAKLHSLGISPEEIGPILITHLHPDHIAELVSLLFALKYITPSRNTPLRLYGCKGIHNLLKNLQQVHGDWILPSHFPIEIHEMAHNEIVDGNFRIASIPVLHTPESIGFRITGTAGSVLAYSGDTEFCAGLVELVKNADLALIECSFPDEKQRRGHMTPSEAGKAAEEGRAKTLILTHLYPECDGADLIRQCRRTYSGTIRIARDLMQVDI